MASVANHIAAKLAVAVQDITLRFEGKTLTATQTAEELDLNDDDVIEAKVRGAA